MAKWKHSPMSTSSGDVDNYHVITGPRGARLTDCLSQGIVFSIFVCLFLTLPPSRPFVSRLLDRY